MLAIVQGSAMPLIIACCAALIAAIYFYGTTQIFVSPFSDPAGPRAYPYLLVILMLVGIAVLLLEQRKARSETVTAPAVEKSIRLSPLLPVSAWTLAYILAFEWLGYPLATAIYLTVLMAVFNSGRHLTNLAVAVGFAAVSYVLLAVLLGAQLPAGRPIEFLISTLHS
jgi:putative tricarboxylic transport membrane protein